MTSDSSPRVVLAVESTATCEMLTALILAGAETELDIVSVSDGGAALGLLTENTPLLLISDIALPVIDGFALCQAVRDIESLEGLPVLLITSGSVDESMRRLALALGATDLVEPTSSEVDLGVLVASYLNRSHADSVPSLGEPSLLAVGVDSETRESLTSVVESMNFGLVSVEDSEAALTALRKESPVVAVFGGVTGAETVVSARNDGWSGAAIFLIDSDDDVAAALKAGADSCLVKPVTGDKLLAACLLAQMKAQVVRTAGLAASCLGQRLIDKEKVSELADGIRAMSHYINNITTSIYGRAQLAQIAGEKAMNKLTDVCMSETPKITAALAAMRTVNQTLQEDMSSGVSLSSPLISIDSQLRALMELTGADKT